MIRRCPLCSAPLEADARLCRRCGGDLSTTRIELGPGSAPEPEGCDPARVRQRRPLGSDPVLWLAGATVFLAIAAVLLAFLFLTPLQRMKAAASSAASSGTRPPAADKAGIEWAAIPGGSFVMGGDRQVTVPAFEMARTEVTNRQYNACVAAGACTPLAEAGVESKGDDHPAVGVSWAQAKAFSEWAGGRLPSEAEWEYAARSAGKHRGYPWGDEDATCARAVISENSAGGPGCGRSATWPVCSKPAGNTEQGLCDMAGNVWEWVEDAYHETFDGAPVDGGARQGPEGSGRVARGGDWRYGAAAAEASFRNPVSPGDPVADVGFRPAR